MGSRSMRLASNTGVFAVGTFMTQLIALVTVPLVTAHISAADFGSVDLVLAVVGICLPLASLCIGEAVLRFGMDKGYDRGKVVSSGFAVGVLGCLLCLAAWPIVQAWPSLSRFFWFGYVLLVGLVLRDVASGYLRAADRIRILVIGGVAQSLLYGVTVVALMRIYTCGLTGYLVALLLSNVVVALFFTIFMVRGGAVSRKGVDRGLARGMLKYSFPLIPNALLWLLVTSVSRFFLLSSHGTEAVGLYAVGVRITTVLVGMTSVFLQAWQLSAIEERNAIDGRVFEGSVFDYLAGMLFVCVGCLLLLIRPLMEFLFSEAYYEAWTVVPSLLFGVVFLTFATFSGTQYKVRMTTSRVLWTSAAGALAAIALSAAIIPRLGLVGAGIATCGGYGVLWLLRAVDVGLPLLSVRQRSVFILSLMLLILQTAALFTNLAPVPSFAIGLGSCLGILILNSRQVRMTIVILLSFVSKGQ